MFDREINLNCIESGIMYILKKGGGGVNFIFNI